MKQRNKILFFILEFISGIVIGIFGFLLVTPTKPKYDLNLSIIIGFLTIFLFALFGIIIPGYFHCKIIKGKYGDGIIYSSVYLILGIILVALLGSITFNLLPYRISSFYIPILTPILFGVLGFNIGINRRMK